MEVVRKEECSVYMKSIQGGPIKALFEVMKEVSQDVSIHIDDSGLRTLSMDSSLCSLVRLNLEADKFEEFHCVSNTTIGLNFGCLFRLIRNTASHDTVTLYIKHNCSNELGIMVQNAETNSCIDSRLKLLDLDVNDIIVPEVEFDSVITLPSAKFHRMCRDSQSIATHMTICCECHKLTLTCSGSYARQEIQIGQSDACMAISHATDAKVQGTFSLKFLTSFSKSFPLCNTVELYMKESFPLVLNYNIASLGNLKFVLAPELDAPDLDE